MAQSGSSSSCKASFTVQEPRYPQQYSEENARRSSHVQAGSSPNFYLSHAWLVELETTQIEEEDEVPYWYIEGSGAAHCIILRDDAKM